VGAKKVFLLDEPTTGLDSSTAYHVVQSIRDFAHIEGVSH
jgi:ABC-type multidrug transport system ATPase subunit